MPMILTQKRTAEKLKGKGWTVIRRDMYKWVAYAPGRTNLLEEDRRKLHDLNHPQKKERGGFKRDKGSRTELMRQLITQGMDRDAIIKQVLQKYRGATEYVVYRQIYAIRKQLNK